MAKNTDFGSASFSYLTREILEQLKYNCREVNEQKEKALDEATDLLVKRLEQNTPVGNSPSGEHLKDKWIAERKYKNVRYINNTKLNEDGVPIVNVLEYSKAKGKPFVRKTFDNCQADFEKIFEKHLKK